MTPQTTTPIYNPTTRRIHYLTTDGLPPNEGRPPQTGDSAVTPRQPTRPSLSQDPPPSRRYSATPHPSTYTPPRAQAWPNMSQRAPRASYPAQRPVSAMRGPPPPYRVSTPGSAFRPQQQPSRQHATGQVAGQAQAQSQATLVWIPWATQQGGSWRYVTRDGGVPFGGRPPPRRGGAGHGRG